MDSGDGDVIVLAVDSSAPSDIAFKFYVENVARPGYILHLVHHSNYWGDLEPMDGGFRRKSLGHSSLLNCMSRGPTPGRCEELIAIENGKVQEIKDRYEEMMAEHNIQGQFVVLRGKDTWHDIIQYQEKTNAIMIVLGTRGQNKLRRTFMGSVSDSVVHHAHCPVLVCCHPKIHDDHHHGHKKDKH